MFLKDEIFTDELIIDELIDFFVAASNTTASVTQTCFHHLTMNKNDMKKLREDIDQNIFEQKGNLDFKEALTYESLNNLEYMPLLLNEGLRYRPPVKMNSCSIMLSDQKIGDYHMRKGDFYFVNLYALAHNPTEWIRPKEFLPERFDSSNPLSKTPSGGKRDPMSFVPFNGGRRVCFGKTFAESSTKVVMSILLH